MNPEFQAPPDGAELSRKTGGRQVVLGNPWYHET